MPIFDIFSKRYKKLWGEVPDGYEYEIIPEGLRVQIIHIWSDIFEKSQHNVLGGPYYPDATTKVFKNIHDILCREYGLLYLTERRDSVIESVHKFLLGTEETVKAIDVIELSFRHIDNYVRNQPGVFYAKISPDEAIAELNHRFPKHGVGYQYESGQIIRIDSEFIHSEAMKPALKMLSDPMYEGANEEFRKAHKHYRKRRYKECMNECLKAFESCIKAICTKRRWKYKETDSINRLIDVVFDKELIPTFMQSHFTALKSTLVSGAPTARNRRSGHGQGANVIPVPEYMAAYALHLTASNILLLAKANDEMK